MHKPTDVKQYLEKGFSRNYKLSGTYPHLAEEVNRVLKTSGVAPALSKEELEGRLVSILEKESTVQAIECRHLDNDFILRLCTDPRLIEVVTQILGPDVILWRSTIIKKGGKKSPTVRWHQGFGGKYKPNEKTYGLEPPVSISLAISITDSNIANGGMYFTPGIWKVLRSTPSNKGKNATMLIDMDHFTPEEVEPVEMKAGQFFVFSDRAPHYSLPNESGEDRIYLVLRLTIPAVRIRKHFSTQELVLIAGQNRTEFNEVVTTAELHERMQQAVLT